MAISGDVFRINQVYELTQKGQFDYVINRPDFTHGWFASGAPGSVTLSSTIDRITWDSDLVTASVRGPLSGAKRYMSNNGVSDKEFGWFSGGLNPTLSTVERIIFKSDSVTATIRGPMSISRARPATVQTLQYGWFSGGGLSSIERISFSNDTQIFSIRGTLTSALIYNTGVSDRKAYGWFCGGSPGPVSRVNRITFSSDTGITTTRGNLSTGRHFISSVYNLDYGWFMGGLAGLTTADYSTSIDRITFANDTPTATVRTSSSTNTQLTTGTGNDNFGWFGGGKTFPAGTTVSTVLRITYTTDTLSLSSRGKLSSSRYTTSSLSGNI